MLPLELSEKLTSNKVIVVEDIESAPGRGYILAKALFNIQNERTSGAEVFTEISPFQTNVQECVLVDSIKDLIVKSENVKDSIFIHSLTPLLINSSVKDVLSLFRKSRESDDIYFLFINHASCIQNFYVKS